jgi:hypothetical protein
MIKQKTTWTCKRCGREELNSFFTLGEHLSLSPSELLCNGKVIKQVWFLKDDIIDYLRKWRCPEDMIEEILEKV